MPTSILITYATRSGSTGEVARFMGNSLLDAGISTQVLPMSEVDSLDGKAAVILGAPLYMGRFPKEFHHFVRRHHGALAALRPWCFVLGPTRTIPQDFEAARNQALKQLSRYPWLHPAELHVFGGRWDPKHMPFPFSLVHRLPAHPLDKIPAMDIRDWAEIREWAAGVVRQCCGDSSAAQDERPSREPAGAAEL
jgi:menaquinone-dependent protoporphyrinogen oxidase